MSHGFTAHADLVQTNGPILVYTYSCWNLNLSGWESQRATADGEIRFNRHDLELVRIPMELLCEAGKVIIKNASGTWQTMPPGVDIMAVRLLRKIVDHYRETGEAPEHVDWFC